MRIVLLVLLSASPLVAAEPQIDPGKQPAKFSWVNPRQEAKYPALRHATFDLDWMAHLRALEIPFELIVVKGVGHSAQSVYKQVGLKVMNFHAENLTSARSKSGN